MYIEISETNLKLVESDEEILDLRFSFQCQFYFSTRGTITDNWFLNICHRRYKVFNENEINMRSEDGLSFYGLVALYFFDVHWILEVVQNVIHTDTEIYLQATFTNVTNMYTQRTYFWTQIGVHLCTLFHFLSFIQYLIHKKHFSSSMHKDTHSTSTFPRKIDDDYLPFRRKHFYLFFRYYLCD